MVEVKTVGAHVNRSPIHWSVSGATPTRVGDAELALGLMPAMRQGAGRLDIGGEVSPLLLENVVHIQNLLSGWDEGMRPVQVVGRQSREPASRGGGAGLFFSGGVDSFYSLCSHRDRITHLVTISGLDGFEDRRQIDMVRSVAADEGVSPIVVSTNARLAVRELNWLQHGHGAVLASAGLLLQADLDDLWIASSYTDGESVPSGTHPDLDPLWSTESLAFHHDALVTRVEKIRALVHEPAALRWLRVCWRRPEEYNCGSCEKCLRTMITLELEDALSRCATFPTALDLRSVRRVRLHSRAVGWWSSLRANAVLAGREDVARSIAHAVTVNRARNLLISAADPGVDRLRQARRRLRARRLSPPTE